MAKNEVHIHVNSHEDVLIKLRRLELLMGRIMTQVNELGTKLQELADKATANDVVLNKVLVEVQGLNAKVAQLEADLANTTLSPEAEASLQALIDAIGSTATLANTLDAQIPDAAV